MVLRALVATCGNLLLVSIAQAQTPVRPRAVADSTYAVRLLVERLSDAIRTGTAAPRVVEDSTLQSAIRLAAASAGSRTGQPPHPRLGPLWDFQFEQLAILALSADRLLVSARVRLVTAIEPAGSCTLTFERVGTQWILTQHQGLVQILTALAGRLKSGSGS